MFGGSRATPTVDGKRVYALGSDGDLLCADVETGKAIWRRDLPADFEVFPPEVSETITPTEDGLTGSKTFEWVLIPRAPGSRELPTVAFGYFDEASGSYRTASTEAIPITVAGTVLEGPAALSRGPSA